MLIVFEGIDGSGKSSQVKMLGESLKALGLTVTESFEPTNGEYGALLRSSATRPEGRYSLDEELELFAKDRKQHVETLIRPRVEAGEVVILDRYYFSTMAYQGARGADPQKVRAHNEEFAMQPDLVFVLNVPTEIALARVVGRDSEADAFEQKEALERCAEIFNDLDDDYVHFIDGSRSAEVVHEEVRRLVTGYML